MLLFGMMRILSINVGRRRFCYSKRNFSLMPPRDPANFRRRKLEKKVAIGEEPSKYYFDYMRNNEMEKSILEQIQFTVTDINHDKFEPIWLVFDVNGTLGSKTKVRKIREKQKRHQRLWLRPRPFVGSMLKLLELSGYFKLAIWSSAREHNVVRSVDLLQTLSGIKFERVLHRGDSIMQPSEKDEYATVKPLFAKGFCNLMRVLLIEDTVEKAYLGEEQNLVLVPPWQENNDDRVLLILAQELLRLPGNVKEEGDVREYSQQISRALRGHEGIPAPENEW